MNTYGQLMDTPWPGGNRNPTADGNRDRSQLVVRTTGDALAPKGEWGRVLLAGWLSWAKRSRIPEFIRLAKTIEKYLPLIHNTLGRGLSNGRVEATNTHLRVPTRRSHGFHTPESLIAMAVLARGGLCPQTPRPNLITPTHRNSRRPGFARCPLKSSGLPPSGHNKWANCSTGPSTAVAVFEAEAECVFGGYLQPGEVHHLSRNPDAIEETVVR
jgi:hypothetical protein